MPYDDGLAARLSVPGVLRQRARDGMVVLFGVSPPPVVRVPSAWPLFRDEVDVHRVQTVFSRVPWPEVTPARMLQYGHDLGYCILLDLPQRAYFMPGLVLAAMEDLDVLDLVTWEHTWRVAPESRRRGRSCTVWSQWSEGQGH